jgi:hypothetical protein
MPGAHWCSLAEGMPTDSFPCRYGHRPEFHGAQSGGGQRRNRFSNMAIVGFTFVFMAVGAVIQMARFNAHYESVWCCC